MMNEGRGGRFAISDGSVPVSFSAFGRQVDSEKDLSQVWILEQASENSHHTKV